MGKETTKEKPSLSLRDYKKKLKKVEAKCRSCGRDISAEPIKHYEHDGGWLVEGYKNKRWLYVECPKCRYQNALWKLGIKRPRGEINE